MELVIPLYCGRKNKVTVVFVSFLSGVEKRNGKNRKKKKRKTQEDTCQGGGMAPDNTTTQSQEKNKKALAELSQLPFCSSEKKSGATEQVRGFKKNPTVTFTLLSCTYTGIRSSH